MEQIHSLVHRHPDKLSIELIKSGNKGYNAEVNVVTYCRGGKESDDRSNFRILLMIPFLPDFWSAWERAYHL